MPFAEHIHVTNGQVSPSAATGTPPDAERTERSGLIYHFPLRRVVRSALDEATVNELRQIGRQIGHQHLAPLGAIDAVNE